MTLAEWRARIAAEGLPAMSRVVVVAGPPAGGKTTYIERHAAVGDVVIDLDAIANAVRVGPASHDYPEYVRSVAMAARLAAIGVAVRLRRQITVWIINTHPSEAQMKAYADDGWTLVVVDPTEAIALARATAAGRPARALAGIRRWYETFTPPAHSTRTEAPQLQQSPASPDLSPSRDW